MPEPAAPNPTPIPVASAPTDATLAGAPQPSPMTDATLAAPPQSPTDATLAARPVPGPPTPDGVTQHAMIGRYRLYERIGRGGMGFVFKAWHEGLERFFALKIIQPTPQTPASLVERFLREARAVARIGKHPNIVQVHDAGQEGSLYYIAMDLVEGTPLDRLTRAGPLDPREAARIARGAAAGLQVAHDAGIVHRDLKPSNVLLAVDKTPLVSDFGIARDTHEDHRVSQEGEVLGTVFYMSPEQASGDRSKVGPATDVYGLGATLYEMLTGRPPFLGANPFEVWTAVVGEEPRAPRAINPGVPPDLETICMKALAKDPSHRYPTARAMADDLDRFLAGDSISARPASAVTRFLWSAARRRRLILPAAASVLVVAAALGWVAHRSAAHDREVASLLEAGLRARAEHRPADARDAFDRLRAIAPELPAARDGYAWADSEVRRLAAETDAARKKAHDDEDRAKETLRKAGLVQAVLARWVLLLPTLAEMERDYYDSSLSSGDKQHRGDDRWPAVDLFMKETPDDPTSQSVMFALAGWARRLAWRETEGIDWMAKARTLDPDLPYGDLMEALVFLSRYLSGSELPALSLGPFGLIVHEAPPERPQLREMRLKMEALLESASRARVWGEGMASEFQGAIRAVQQMQAGKYAEAEAAYASLLGTAALSGFRSDILLARGKVRYLLLRFDEAIGDLDRVIEARPRGTEGFFFRGLIRAAKGDELLVAQKNPLDAYKGALADLDEALRLTPHWYFALLARGTAYLAKARASETFGANAAECYESAVRDFGEAIGQAPMDPTARLNRSIALGAQAGLRLAKGEEAWDLFDAVAADCEAGLRTEPDFVDLLRALGNMCLQRGEAELRAERDPSATLERGVRTFTRILEQIPGDAESILGRGVAWATKADWLAAHRGDPRECWKKCKEAFEDCIAKEPRFYQGYANLGMYYEQQGQFEEAAKTYEAGLKVVPNEPTMKEAFARTRAMAEAAKRPAPAWAKVIREGRKLSEQHDYVAARAKLEEAMAAITAEEWKQPLYAQFFVELHYDLGCIYALLAVGKEGPDAEAKAITAEEAERWTDKAFEQLRKSVQTGWCDMAHLMVDEDLVKLHDDPRWAELIKARPR